MEKRVLVVWGLTSGEGQIGFYNMELLIAVFPAVPPSYQVYSSYYACYTSKEYKKKFRDSEQNMPSR